jgi:tetratricopeptide (TPR) repeat protein
VSAVKTHMLRNEYAQAGRIAEQVLAQSGGNSARGMDEVLYLSGLSYLKQGKYALAAGRFNEALSGFPSGSFAEEARIGIADTHFLDADYRKAAGMYEAMLRKSAYRDFKPALYARLRLIALKTGDTEKAQKYASKLAAQYSQSPEYRHLAAAAPGIQRSSGRVTSVPSGVEPLYYVQVGAFGNRTNAERLKDKLIAQGYRVHIVHVEVSGTVTYKVRVGGVNTRILAEQLKFELSDQGLPTAICQ